MDPSLSRFPSAPARRRELLRQYKDAFPRMGVFALRHLGSGRVYVGASTALDAAMQRLRFELTLGQHRGNRALQEDWRRFGEAAFVFEVLDVVKQRDDAAFDYAAEVAAMHTLWCEELLPYGERGYLPAPKAAR